MGRPDMDTQGGQRTDAPDQHHDGQVPGDRSLTAGCYGLFQWEMGGPSGAAPLFHRTLSESFYILSGTVALYDGASWAEGTAGDFHYVPEGGIHAFRNADPDTPARLGIEVTPSSVTGSAEPCRFSGLLGAGRPPDRCRNSRSEALRVLNAA